MNKSFLNIKKNNLIRFDFLQFLNLKNKIST